MSDLDAADEIAAVDAVFVRPDAAEGLTWETAMGTVEMRAYDHQIITPMISGKTVCDPDWPDFVILGDMKYIPGEDAARTIDELIADGHPGH